MNFAILPNLLTASRLLAACGIFLWPNVDSSILLVLISWAALSDWADGFLARRLDCESAFGAIFDPVADKIFVAFLAFHLWCVDSLPMFWVVPTISRDLLIVLGGVIAKIRYQVTALPPIYISKINTALQFGVFACILIKSQFLSVMMVASLITTCWSGVMYACIFKRMAQARTVF